MRHCPTLLRRAALLGVLAVVGSSAQAGVSVSVGIGLPLLGVQIGGGGHRHNGGHFGGYYGGHSGYYGGYYRGWGPSLLIAAPPLVWIANPPVVLAETTVVQPAPQTVVAPAPSRADPVIYPRNGQSAPQTEYDRQECNRWATTQPAALAEASVFQRAVEACMDGRGYTLK